MTPPLPEIVDSVPGADVATEELSAVTLELLVVEERLVSSREEATEGPVAELDGIDAVVDVATADVAPTALDVAVAAGSELPQPLMNRAAAAAAVAMNTDLDASMHFMVARVVVDRLRGAGFAERTRHRHR